ncbi:MAG: hypothetical protein ACYS7Y_04100 [Planctomycetota bacterium]|jgi:hypothetical protein
MIDKAIAIATKLSTISPWIHSSQINNFAIRADRGQVHVGPRLITVPVSSFYIPTHKSVNKTVYLNRETLEVVRVR